MIATRLPLYLIQLLSSLISSLTLPPNSLLQDEELQEKLDEKEMELDKVTDDHNWSEIAKKELTDQIETLKYELNKIKGGKVGGPRLDLTEPNLFLSNHLSNPSTSPFSYYTLSPILFHPIPSYSILFHLIHSNPVVICRPQQERTHRMQER